MKRTLLLPLLSFLACLACRAAAQDPWISVGGSGPIGPASGGWAENARFFDVEGGTALVVKGDDGWTLLLDGALVEAADDPVCVLFDGGDAGLPLDVCLSGGSVLSGGGIEARNCSLLSLRGPGSLSVTRPASAGEGAAVDCDGDLFVADALVAAFAGGGSALQAAGSVTVSGGAAVLLGANGIRAADVSIADSAVGICASGEAVLADGSFVAENAEAFAFAAADFAEGLQGDDALQDFFDDPGVAAFLAARSAPRSTDRPKAGVVAASRAGGSAAASEKESDPPICISFDGNGAIAEPGFALIPAGGQVGLLPRPTLDDHVLLGWYTSPTGGAPVRATTRFSEEATIYARWAKSTYKIYFRPSGGTGDMELQALSYGTESNLFTNRFSRPGWVFLGWSKTPGGALAFGDGAAVKNLTLKGGVIPLYALWAKSSYRIAFDANGGKGSMAAQPMTYGTAAALPGNAFSRKGWVFLGWATTKGGAVAFADAQSVRNLTKAGGTVRLYAKWARESYEIAFDPNCGAGRMSSLSMKWGKARTLPRNAFARNGQMFLGWALSADDAAAQKVDFRNGQSVQDLVTATGTVTLYAVWKRYVPKTAGRIRFALCQTPCTSSSSTAQIDATFAWARQSLKGDEDVIVFPELAFAPFTELKTAWKQGATVRKKAAAFARERNAYVLVNHPYRESSASKMYNETRVFAPDGTVLAIYRKRVLARMDTAASFSSGDTDVMARLPFAHLGLLICKDAFTPSKGSDRYRSADILLVQFAHPGVDNRSAPEAKSFPSSAQSMADMRNSRNGWRKLGKPYMAVNKFGPDGNYTLCGGTFAATAAGGIVTKADAVAKVVFADYPLQWNGRIQPVPAAGR